MNFISCAKWIKKGVAKSNPEKVQLTQDELQKIIDSTREQLKDLEEDEDANETPMEQGDAKPGSSSDRYNFEHYDTEDIADDTVFGIGNLVVNDDEYALREENHDSEEEDDAIKLTDNLIAVGHIEGDASVLEVFVYNEQDGDLYVHHDILLPSIPLCLEWLSYEPTDPSPGNLLAIGSMSAVISVWDLDIVDCLEPAYLLGKFSVKKRRNKSHGHKDAVLDIAWNRSYKHILASGSVDKTVLLWDLDEGKATTTFDQFQGKVQSIKWHSDYHLLLSGSSDKTAKLFDCRMTEVQNEWSLKDEIEKVSWCPWDNNLLYFGTLGGTIMSYDLRNPNNQLWEVQAHSKEITGLELDINCPNLLVTCSADEVIKIWDIEDTPKLKSSKALDLEELQCLNLNPDCPYVACIGGTKRKKNFKVMNLKHEMLQTVDNTVVDTNPVVFNETANSTDNSLQLTENAFQSMSLKNKKIKSKKKFGHKFRRS